MGSTGVQVFIGLVLFTLLVGTAVLVGTGLGAIRDVLRVIGDSFRAAKLRELTLAAVVALACCAVAGAIGYAAASALS